MTKRFVCRGSASASSSASAVLLNLRSISLPLRPLIFSTHSSWVNSPSLKYFSFPIICSPSILDTSSPWRCRLWNRGFSQNGEESDAQSYAEIQVRLQLRWPRSDRRRHGLYPFILSPLAKPWNSVIPLSFNTVPLLGFWYPEYVYSVQFGEFGFTLDRDFMGVLNGVIDLFAGLPMIRIMKCVMAFMEQYVFLEHSLLHNDCSVVPLAVEEFMLSLLFTVKIT